MEAAIDEYVSSPFPVRSFTLRRQILHHDSNALKKLIFSLVGSTDYRGHTEITFSTTHDRVKVYSPCWQNRLRDNTWVQSIFYLTFLWIFSWPYLWFVTRHWEVLVSQFPYSSNPLYGNRTFLTKSEKDLFQEWRLSLRRAVLGRKQGWLDEEYKLATEEAMAEGASGFLHHTVTVGRDVAIAGGGVLTVRLPKIHVGALSIRRDLQKQHSATADQGRCNLALPPILALGAWAQRSPHFFLAKPCFLAALFSFMGEEQWLEHMRRPMLENAKSQQGEGECHLPQDQAYRVRSRTRPLVP